MLTRKQIQLIAQRNRVPLYTQERDYIQAVFLSLLYTRMRDFVFKGGTCLRMLYNSPRYSEDLDFNSKMDEKGALMALKEAIAELELFGIKGELRDFRSSASGFGMGLSYAGPLFDGRDLTKGLVRIDVSLRGEEVEHESRLYKSEYDDVKSFPVLAATLEHIFAEKVRALMLRGKARDLYDLWFLAEVGVKADVALINEKLKLYSKSFGAPEFEKSIGRIKREWNRDLRPLLAAPPPYEAAAEKVISYFAGL